MTHRAQERALGPENWPAIDELKIAIEEQIVMCTKVTERFSARMGSNN